MTYSRPKQERAKITEERFLVALNTLLQANGFAQTTTQDIAKEAGLTKASFLKRFGNKETALLKLYEQYCEEAHETMDDIIHSVAEYSEPLPLLLKIVESYESLVLRHFASNRAMQEHFQTNLQVHPLTKSIFQHSVVMMQTVQQVHLKTATPPSAYASAQLLVTLVYNHCLHAMPGMPRSQMERHNLIAEILMLALKK